MVQRREFLNVHWMDHLGHGAGRIIIKAGGRSRAANRFPGGHDGRQAAVHAIVKVTGRAA